MGCVVLARWVLSTHLAVPGTSALLLGFLPLHYGSARRCWRACLLMGLT